MQKILVIDDDLLLLNAIQFLLDNKGYKTITIPTTEDVFATIEQERPDLILLDVYLAGEDGRDFCLTLKSEPLSKDIPVVILSGDYRVEEDIHQYGANDFLLKPFQINNLFKMIERNIANNLKAHKK
ncbi:MAG: response regulator [Ilyomonas sp.]